MSPAPRPVYSDRMISRMRLHAPALPRLQVGLDGHFRAAYAAETSGSEPSGFLRLCYAYADVCSAPAGGQASAVRNHGHG